ncbi:DUF927 domain-containing protein [Chitinimonas taiwanensis]|uniref:Putative DNA primase/helicase n=1 Tax=Chitinimonas taiwanensis DSM 18899 TaxID=1121279 RepID=A0A1K2HMK6_9NEIS|nr:DUF927 domain-containing protein [Chitinimonas taiwanensis]SFZ78007.1 putative DNA primase/helicase [Chitinimonas taiwanensis DSM 18899]
MSRQDDEKILQHAASLPPDPIDPGPTLGPRVAVTEQGVCYVGTKVDAQTGAVTELPPMWLCDKLEIIGRGTDEGGEHYRILSWQSRGNRHTQIKAIPLSQIGERASWAMLRAHGLALATNRRALEQLAAWLQTGGSDTMHQVTERGGWLHGAYVLPSGEIIGTPDVPLFYLGDQSHANAYKVKGSVDGWRDSVAALARGNTRPMLAIGAALAAPLLGLVGLESGGFHLYGPSGCGKTTSANVGASVWGLPREQLLNWDATAIALANAAAARNDGLMLLDEMGQGSPEAVSMAAYRLFNGTGKMQGAKEGGNRDMLRWRVLVLSTGEIDLAAFMQGGGRRTRAGQEVRLASLPADAGQGLGAFETLHGHENSNALARALDEAVQAEHGTAGRALVAHVAANRPALAKRLQLASLAPDYLAGLHAVEASGQVRRVAARFAVTGEALEIATEAGLTGWAAGEGHAAMQRCFHDWLKRYGLGNREESQVIEQAEAWFAANAFARFIDWHDAGSDREPLMPNCAGYRRRTDTGVYWLVFPGVFCDELAEGFDKTMAASTLAKVDMLQTGNDGKSTSVHKTPDLPRQPRRFYKFIAIVRKDETEAEATASAT